MRLVAFVPGVAVVAVVLAVSGCGASHSSAAPAGGTASSPPASGASTTAAASTGAASPAGSPSAPAPAVASAGGVQNLTVDDSVRKQLIAAIAPVHNAPVSDIASTAPRSVYYAYDPATSTYYAMARFELAAGDPLRVQVSFQDAGAYGLFKRAGHGPWQAQNGGLPNICAEVKFFPAPVLAAWNQPATPADLAAAHCS